MALFGGMGGGARMGGFGGAPAPRMRLQDVRRVQQQRQFFQPAVEQPDESQDFFVDPSVTGATTYTNQPPAPSMNSNAYRLSQMRAARPITMARPRSYLSGY